MPCCTCPNLTLWSFSSHIWNLKTNVTSCTELFCKSFHLEERILLSVGLLLGPCPIVQLWGSGDQKLHLLFLSIQCMNKSEVNEPRLIQTPSLWETVDIALETVRQPCLIQWSTPNFLLTPVKKMLVASTLFFKLKIIFYFFALGSSSLPSVEHRDLLLHTSYPSFILLSQPPTPARIPWKPTG